MTLSETIVECVKRGIEVRIMPVPESETAEFRLCAWDKDGKYIHFHRRVLKILLESKVAEEVMTAELQWLYTDIRKAFRSGSQVHISGVSPGPADGEAVE